MGFRNSDPTAPGLTLRPTGRKATRPRASPHANGSRNAGSVDEETRVTRPMTRDAGFRSRGHPSAGRGHSALASQTPRSRHPAGWDGWLHLSSANVDGNDLAVHHGSNIAHGSTGLFRLHIPHALGTISSQHLRRRPESLHDIPQGLTFARSFVRHHEWVLTGTRPAQDAAHEEAEDPQQDADDASHQGAPATGVRHGSVHCGWRVRSSTG